MAKKKKDTGEIRNGLEMARLAGAKKAELKKGWGNLIEAAKSAKGVGRMWTRSRSRSEDSVSSDGSGGTSS